MVDATPPPRVGRIAICVIDTLSWLRQFRIIFRLCSARLAASFLSPSGATRCRP
jgi:hypothetical protein